LNCARVTSVRDMAKGGTLTAWRGNSTDSTSAKLVALPVHNPCNLRRAARFHRGGGLARRIDFVKKSQGLKTGALWDEGSAPANVEDMSRRTSSAARRTGPPRRGRLWFPHGDPWTTFCAPACTVVRLRLRAVVMGGFGGESSGRFAAHSVGALPPPHPGAAGGFAQGLQGIKE